MLKKILIVAILVPLVLIVAVVGVIAMQPADYRVERSTTIAAPPDAVFPHINGLQKWDAWSPWAKLDPDAKYTYEGPSSGKGAIVRWNGNDEVGEGQMAITESRPNELVRIKLDFLRPMEGTAMVDFTFKAEGDQTRLTWSMHGQNSFICKAISMVCNVDKMIGDNMEEGLASIKATVETANR
jgi:hypothetical protein